MIKEVGLNIDGDIEGEIALFTRKMESELPKNRLIEIGEEQEWMGADYKWYIHDWMIDDEKDTLEKIIGDL